MHLRANSQLNEGDWLMNRLSRVLFLVAATVLLGTMFQSEADAQTKGAASAQRPAESLKTKMNAWTVGLAGGLLEGAPIRLAAEMARVVDDESSMHVLPIVTRGPRRT